MVIEKSNVAKNAKLRLSGGLILQSLYRKLYFVIVLPLISPEHQIQITP